MRPGLPRRPHPWSRNPVPGIAVLVAGGALTLFLGMTATILFFPAFQDVDERISAAVRGIESDAITSVARLLTTLGGLTVMGALTVFLAIALFVRRWHGEALLLTLTMVAGTTAGFVLKQLIDRARPGIEFARIPVPESYSFPSGHALSAFLFFGVLAFIFFVRAKEMSVKAGGMIACLILVLGVALSRVYLGVHYLGDIIASWMLGSAFLVVFVSGYIWWVTRRE